MTTTRGLRPLALLSAWLLAILAAAPATASRPAFDRHLDQALEAADVAGTLEAVEPAVDTRPEQRFGLLLAPPYPDTRFRALGPQPLPDVFAWGQIIASTEAGGGPKTRVRGFELLLGVQRQAIQEFGLEIVVGSGIYLDPELGRFLSEDPVAGNASDPPSLHRYLYVHANPTTGIDSDGRERVEIEPATKAGKRIQHRYREAYEAFRAVPGGDAAARQLEERTDVTLKVSFDEDRLGLVVADYLFDEGGNLTGATLTVGSRFDKAPTNAEDYPFGSQLSKKDERRIYAVAHEEQGHFLLAVEDPSYLETLKAKEEINGQVRALRAQAEEAFPGKSTQEYQRLLREEGVDQKHLEKLGTELENRADEVGEAWVGVARGDLPNPTVEKDDGPGVAALPGPALRTPAPETEDDG